jgi:ubiquinone/menaquinone biosynthesis C-methylase UbiE/pimeloyl-ACP methyl ester carboxylesterase
MEARKTQEQRRHTRVKHARSVIVNAEGGTFSGSTVNISRSGMQLIVNMPDSYREIRSITFTLPSSTETVDIPCQLVRVEKNSSAEQQALLGVQLSCESEAQMLLIENFVREGLSQSIQDGSGESRLVPRSKCAIATVSTNRTDLRVLSIENISTEGLLLRFHGNLAAGDVLPLEFALPGDSRSLRLTGEVLYVIENPAPGVSASGIKFLTQSAIVQAKIRNFIVASASGSAMRSACEDLFARDVGHEFRVVDQRQIIAAFCRLQRERFILNSLFEGNLHILELKVAIVNPKLGTWTATRDEGGLHRDFPMPVTGYFSFSLEGGSYYFKSEFCTWSDGKPVLKIPQILYRSEKRSYKREPLAGADETVSLCLQASLQKNIRGKVLDISRHGFLCEIPHSMEILGRVRSGQPLEYSSPNQLGISYTGQIRHISEAVKANGQVCLRIGVQAGITRGRYRFRKFSTPVWNLKRTRKPAAPSFRAPLLSEVISYRNGNGQQIMALLNRTGDPRQPSTVVIIPPAFGKKKEVSAVLASTLLANFRHRNQNLVVLRYDGINRPGESLSEQKAPKRGYEMLHYRIRQGFDDLKTTINFVYDNPIFRPDRVALISASMSALECRRLLAMGERRVHFWISLMGAPAAQTVLINTLGGLDIIGNARIGIPNGINGLLGYLLDMDIMARDLIEHRYAYLSDARQDLARIPLPVLWVYGTHDRWLSPDEIRDIMGVQSGAEREILEVPTGHNLRSSEDALRTFRLITSWLYSQIHHKHIVAYEPDREQLLKLVGWERERLLQAESIQPQEYWKSYLLGDDNRSPGYDFYRKLQDFQSFFATQAELLRPEEGGRIADMGCGTGLMLEQLLERVAAAGAKSRSLSVAAVDLVPEALERSAQKWAQACQHHPQLQEHKLECLQMDLTPNKLVPVRNFTNDPSLPFSYLRNRIAGLTTEILRRLEERNSTELRALMTGAAINEPIRSGLSNELSAEEYAVVVDFNRASRFLGKHLFYSDLLVCGKGNNPDSPIEESRYDTLLSSDLCLDRLNFGSCGCNLQLCFADASFDKLIASLFISYLSHPDDLLCEFFRILKPGGLLLVSSMKPDSDISEIFTSYVDQVLCRDPKTSGDRDQDLNGARSMLNEASSIMQLEEDGFFCFYTSEELNHLVESVGFEIRDSVSAIGNPPQAVIVTAKKPA